MSRNWASLIIEWRVAPAILSSVFTNVMSAREREE
jgi:hypothetical protein